MAQDIVITLSDTQVAAMQADISPERPNLTVEQYLIELIFHRIVDPAVERNKRAEAVVMLEKFQQLSVEDKAAVEIILDKAKVEKA